MKIGITFNVKDDAALQDGALPDDAQEEFDAPETIEAIAEVLRRLGHDVVLLGDGRPMLEQLLADPPEFVFNIAEGVGVSRSREARVPAVLEMLGIPYTGSDPLTMAATLDKGVAKKLAAAAGVAVPKECVITPEMRPDRILRQVARLPFPVIAKPAWEGSSKGIRSKCLVQTIADTVDVVQSLWRDHGGQPVLVEEFIQGDELTVGMIGNDPPKVLAIMRVLPKLPVEQFVYSLEIKRDFRRLVDYEVPPKLAAADLEAIESAAQLAFQALGCRDVARIDFRLRRGVPVFLEVNPLPGLKPRDSDLVIMAELKGWTYCELIDRILAVAVSRVQSNCHADRQFKSDSEYNSSASRGTIAM